jgi:type I restriction enzyme S subunit
MRNPAFWDAGDFPWVSSGDVKTSRLSDTNQHVTSYAVRCGAAVVVPTDSIVIVTRSGILRNYLPVALISRAMAINQDIKVLIPAKTVNNDYLLHALTGFGDQILSRCLKAGTTVESVEFPWLKAFHIPLPPLTEQRVIAEALSDMDELLGALDRLIAKKRDIKQATMQLLLTGKTRLPGFSGKWEVKKLGDVGAFHKGSGVKKDEARSGDLPCVRYGEIYTHHNDYVRVFNSWISREVAETATLLRQGDIMFAGSGETKEEIGKCVAFVDNVEAYAGGDIVILRPTCVDSLFLGYLLNTPEVSSQKASRGQGDAVVHISSSALASISLSLPQLAEQTAIASVLSDIDAELSALEARRDKTRALKQGMMQELLTGKTRLI